METESERIIRNVYNWLQNTYCVNVDGDWLQACIFWLREKIGQQNDVFVLRNQVFEQWLLSDLSESGVASLPSDNRTNQPGIIDESLPLQINSIIDIGASAYSQLKKFKGENVSESEAKSTQYQPHHTPTRMLKMELTDGHSTVQGFEYRPIQLLHSQLPPGTKILIKGNPLFKNGVIFLEKENIKILGGKVEGLLEVNSQANVLQHRLDMKNDTTTNQVCLNNNMQTSVGGGTSRTEQGPDIETLGTDESNTLYGNEENNGIDEFFDEDESDLANLNLDAKGIEEMSVDIFNEMACNDIPDELLNDLLDGF